MTHYRTYTLLLGQTIPLYDFGDCRIIEMPQEEQEERDFSPIQSKFSQINRHDSYITSLPYVDPIKISSRFVLVHDVEERDFKAAIGASIRTADRISQLLTITNIFDSKKEYDRMIGEPYLYQINKIYEIVDEDGDEVEKEIDSDLKSRHVFLPDRPESTEWKNEASDEFFYEVASFRNNTLQKSLGYLYEGAIGHLQLNEPEKISLDLFKAIEVIIEYFAPYNGSGRMKGDRIPKMASALDLSEDNVSDIEDFWDLRNKNDVAHATNTNPTARYPNQFPLPKGVHKSAHRFSSVVKTVVLNFYFYLQRKFTIEVMDRITADEEDEPILGEFTSEENNHLFYRPAEEKEFTKHKEKAIELFTEEADLSKDDLEISSDGNKKVIEILIKEGVDLPEIGLSQKMDRIKFI